MTQGNFDLLFYAGGFDPTAGNEVFFHDLLLELKRLGFALGVACWGVKGTLLLDLERAGVEVSRSPVRWACRWAVPDRVLFRRFSGQVVRAKTVVFGKLGRNDTQEALLGRKRASTRYVLIANYRPSEMWRTNQWARRPSTAALQSIDAICVQAPSSGEELRSEFGYRGEVKVIPYLPPRVQNPAPFPDGPKFRIGFLGRLVPDKNLRYLLASFAELRRKIDAELHFFGEGPEKSALDRGVSRLNLGRDVCFHGLIKRDDLARAIDSCHAFAFSSTTEGQCLAALEVLARGRPLVCTPVGSFAEILRSNIFGHLAPLDNQRRFADELEAVFHEVFSTRQMPDLIQAEFRKRFPREGILQEYRSVLTTST